MTDQSTTFRFKTTISTGLKIAFKSIFKFIGLNIIIFLSSIPFFLIPALIYISFQNVIASIISAGISFIFILILGTYFKLSFVKFSINQIKQESTRIMDSFDISFQQFGRSCLAYLRIYLPTFIAALIITGTFGAYAISNLFNGPTGTSISDFNTQPVYLNQITSESPSAILNMKSGSNLLNFGMMGFNIVNGLIGIASVIFAIIFTLVNLLRYLFANYLILDQDLTVKEAFSQAKITMYGNKLKLIGFFFVNTIIFSLPITLISTFSQNAENTIAIIIGAILFILSIFLKNYFNLSLAAIYQQLFLLNPVSTKNNQQPPTPIIETTNPQPITPIVEFSNLTSENNHQPTSNSVAQETSELIQPTTTPESVTQPLNINLVDQPITNQINPEPLNPFTIEAEPSSVPPAKEKQTSTINPLPEITLTPTPIAPIEPIIINNNPANIPPIPTNNSIDIAINTPPLQPESLNSNPLQQPISSPESTPETPNQAPINTEDSNQNPPNSPPTTFQL